MAKKPKQPPPEIVRKHLAELASALPLIVEHERRLKETGRIFAPTISPRAAEFVQAALAEFKAAGGKSLDRAFGLTRRGAPIKSGREAKNYELAKEVFWRWHLAEAGHKGHSWKHISRSCGGRSERYLRRLMERYAPDIIAEASERVINSAE